jgi:hypothetical protein
MEKFLAPSKAEGAHQTFSAFEDPEGMGQWEWG